MATLITIGFILYKLFIFLIIGFMSLFLSILLVGFLAFLGDNILDKLMDSFKKSFEHLYLYFFLVPTLCVSTIIFFLYIYSWWFSEEFIFTISAL